VLLCYTANEKTENSKGGPMKSVFDMEKLERLLKDFYAAVGIRISVFDDDFRLVTEYPREAPRYCSYIRSVEAGRLGCEKCDLEAFHRAKEQKQAHVYVCHAGVLEAITPIRYENTVLGYVILAHMMPKESYDEAFAEALSRLASYGLDTEKGKRYLKEIRSHRREQILACAHILDAVASYMYAGSLVKRRSEELSVRISDYIGEHLNEGLDVSSLTRRFALSRTRLFCVFKECFGMSVSRYIQEKRIEKAKNLLDTTSFSVGEIALLVGYTEGNYFSKVFKKETGLAPTEYRRG